MDADRCLSPAPIRVSAEDFCSVIMTAEEYVFAVRAEKRTFDLAIIRDTEHVLDVKCRTLSHEIADLE